LFLNLEIFAFRRERERERETREVFKVQMGKQIARRKMVKSIMVKGPVWASVFYFKIWDLKICNLQILFFKNINVKLVSVIGINYKLLTVV
jgi:hypothetical protein